MALLSLVELRQHRHSCTVSPAHCPNLGPVAGPTGEGRHSASGQLRNCSVPSPNVPGLGTVPAMPSSHLSENVPHLGLLVPEALYLLGDPGVLLQLLQSCPLAVQVGAAEGKKERNVAQEASGPDPATTQ